MDVVSSSGLRGDGGGRYGVSIVKASMWQVDVGYMLEARQVRPCDRLKYLCWNLTCWFRLKLNWPGSQVLALHDSLWSERIPSVGAGCSSCDRTS